MLPFTYHNPNHTDLGDGDKTKDSRVQLLDLPLIL